MIFFLYSCSFFSYFFSFFFFFFFLVFFFLSFFLSFFLCSYLFSSYILACLLFIFSLVISSCRLVVNICHRLYILLNQISRCIIKQSEEVFLKVIFKFSLTD